LPTKNLIIVGITQHWLVLSQGMCKEELAFVVILFGLAGFPRFSYIAESRLHFFTSVLCHLCIQKIYIFHCKSDIGT